MKLEYAKYPQPNPAVDSMYFLRFQGVPCLIVSRVSVVLTAPAAPRRILPTGANVLRSVPMICSMRSIPRNAKRKVSGHDGLDRT